MPLIVDIFRNKKYLKQKENKNSAQLELMFGLVELEFPSSQKAIKIMLYSKLNSTQNNIWTFERKLLTLF